MLNKPKSYPRSFRTRGRAVALLLGLLSLSIIQPKISYGLTIQPAITRVMWVPHHTIRNGIIVPARCYYIRILEDRWQPVLDANREYNVYDATYDNFEERLEIGRDNNAIEPTADVERFR